MAEAMTVASEPCEERGIGGERRAVFAPEGIQGIEIRFKGNGKDSMGGIFPDLAIDQRAFRVLGKPVLMKPIPHEIVEHIIHVPNQGFHEDGIIRVWGE